MRRDDRERLKGGGGDLFVVPCEGLDRRMIAQIPYLRERDREREREGERERGGWGGKGVATVEQASEGFDHKNEQRERARRTLNPKPKPQSRHGPWSYDHKGQKKYVSQYTVCVPYVSQYTGWVPYVSQYTVCVYTDLGASIIRARKKKVPAL
jgi:hypothetical protein